MKFGRNQKTTILVLHYNRGRYPLRESSKNHTYFWSESREINAVYLNVAFQFSVSEILAIQADVIVLSTSFCARRSNISDFDGIVDKLSALVKQNIKTIAIPQDEFYLTDSLSAAFAKLKVSVILTCLKEVDWLLVYGQLEANEVSFQTVLTGYVNQSMVKWASKNFIDLKERTTDIAYRAFAAPPWLGTKGWQKTKIAHVMKPQANAQGLKVDISLDDRDVLAGRDWYRFLLNARTTIGVESGASVLDRDGSIRERTMEYLAENPAATFQETSSKCFEEEDGKLHLHCIAPRHFEAIATKTVQILLEGTYSDILQSDVHYIQLNADFGNIDSVLKQISDDRSMQRLAERAYSDIIGTKKYTYSKFLDNIRPHWEEPANTKSLKCIWARFTMNRKDQFNWMIIRAECFYLRNLGWIRPFVRPFKPLYLKFVRQNF